MSLSFKPQCVLFDLDGTLLDTAPDLGGAANRVRADLGLPPLPIAQYRPAASAGARGLLGMALGIAEGDAEWPQRRDAFLDHYRRHLADESVLFPGMAELLAALERHDIRWGIVTNKPGWLTTPLVHLLNLDTRAACSISGDDAPLPKPAPDPILLACSRIGATPSHCVYVGDDKRDIDAGHAAGLHTVAVRWGYLGSNGAIESWQADDIVDTPEDLAQLLALPAVAVNA